MTTKTLEMSEAQAYKLPGRPLRTVPVSIPSAITGGDHILFLINSSKSDRYRPVYQSALVESVSNGNVVYITYTILNGVHLSTQLFSSFKSLHKVDYTDEWRETAVEKARRRLGERHYHGLFNNSHHFVSWTKTGLEYSMGDLVHGVEEPWTDDYDIKPVLMKASVDSIEDCKPADHLMDDSNNHWLIRDVYVMKSSFTAYTVVNEAVTVKELPWRNKLFRIQYPHSCTGPTRILRTAELELGKQSTWESSDRFITKMKMGQSFAISEDSLINASCVPASCTRVTPYVVLDRGDHLIVKASGEYRSVLIEAIVDSDTIVCVPDLDGREFHGDLMISGKEVYRVNYVEHLPPDEVLRRAESKEGQQLLRSCQQDASIFVSWAITGIQSSVDAEKLIKNQELKQVRPICYKRITTEMCHEVQPGDHLFVDYTARYRWHFMVTEVCAEKNTYKTVYYLRGSVKETIETVDPLRLNVYKVIYAEEFVPTVAIRRARSRVGEKKVDLWARVEFVRWAKTGSDEGVEIDLMTNCSVPLSKSSIACFQQLNPGDYLIIEEDKLTPYRHCLVLDVFSPTSCTVMEVWMRSICQANIDLQPSKHSYYRLNYNTNIRVCRPAKESITLARKLYEECSLFSKYSRQKFVNFLKTGDDLHTVDINSLQDDRILLPRETVVSALQLKRGDHIERPLRWIGEMVGYHHHMLVLKVVDDRRCKVIHCGKGRSVTGSSIRKETVDIFEAGTVSRVKYTERIDPKIGIAQLKKLTESDSSSEKESAMKRDYNVFNNNCEHIVMIGTIGTPVSIQVDINVYRDLHHQANSMSPGLGDACLRAASKGAIKTVVKLAGTAIMGVRPGGLTVSHGAAEAAQTTFGAAIAKLNSFRVGCTAALRTTTIGFVAGIALGTNLIMESPLLVRNVYKIHRKRKFEVISETEAWRQGTIQAITSANTVIGGTAGAIAGQVFIPIPILGAMLGGFAGVIMGKSLGNLEGRGVAKLVNVIVFPCDKETDLPVVLHCMYVPMPMDH